jgi:hypothetical protein
MGCGIWWMSRQYENGTFNQQDTFPHIATIPLSRMNAYYKRNGVISHSISCCTTVATVITHSLVPSIM